MKILMIVIYFVPENRSAAHIYFDLAKAFVKRGHAVDVITSYPRNFNLDKKDLNEYFPIEETIDGIKVHRCKYHFAKRDIIALRGLEHFRLPRVYFKRYKKLDKKFDVCLIYIPPLSLYKFGEKIRKIDNIPFLLNYQDIHPQELIDVGVLKNKLMIKMIERMERRSYAAADYITVMSKMGKELISNRGGNPNTITHIYNSVSLPTINEYLKKRDFKKKEEIEDKTLVSYAGILYPFQGIDDIVDAAKKLKEHDDITFYIVGDGTCKNHLVGRVKDEKIHNVKIMPLQPREEYFNIINSSDISIVSLDKRMTAPAIPGKFINLLAAEQPIIANVPSTNETALIIKKAKCGIVTEPGNNDEIAKAIIKLKDEPELRRKMGVRGRQFLEEEMNLEKNVVVYEHIFKSIVAQG